jgi:hypothetical protein
VTVNLLCDGSVCETDTFCNISFVSVFTGYLNDRKDSLINSLMAKRVSVIVCQKFSEVSVVKELLHLVTHDIKLYPPIQCQIRSLDNTISCETKIDVVTSRMSYIANIDTIASRKDKRIASMNILYQVYEPVLGAAVEIRYGMDYFRKDERALACTLKGLNIPELRYDYHLQKDVRCDNVLILKISFIAGSLAKSPNLAGESGWILHGIQTWPSFDIDVPPGPITDAHGFYRVTEQLGQKIFQYLNFYGVGRHPI